MASSRATHTDHGRARGRNTPFGQRPTPGTRRRGCWFDRAISPADGDDPVAPVASRLKTRSRVSTRLTTTGRVASSLPAVASSLPPLVTVTGACHGIARTSSESHNWSTRQRITTARNTARLVHRACGRTLVSKEETTVQRNCRQFPVSWFRSASGRYMVDMEGECRNFGTVSRGTGLQRPSDGRCLRRIMGGLAPDQGGANDYATLEEVFARALRAHAP